MSKNIDQVFIANPITTNAGTDLMYFGQSPYGVGNDAAMLYSNFAKQFSPLTTKGDLYTFSTVNARLAVGTTNGQILQVNSAAAVGLSYSTPTYPSASGAAGKILRSDATNNVYSTATFADTYAVSTLLYASGANVVTGLATANSATLVTSSVGDPAWVSMTNGQVLIGSTGGTPAANTIGVSGNLSTTTGPTSFSINTTGAANYSFVDETTTSRTLTSFEGVFSDNVGLVTLTIPASCNDGDLFEVVGKGSGGWKIQANTGQTIHFGSNATSVAGSLASTNQYDSMQFVCVTANTTFVVRSSIGNITVA